MAGQTEYRVYKDYWLGEFDGSGRSVKSLYVETHIPDKNMLQKLLKAAIGRKRTLDQFVTDCNDPKKCRMNTEPISVNMVKRILSDNEIVRPLKPEVIQAMLNNADDRFIVNPYDLMRANGLEEAICVERAKELELSLSEKLKKEQSFLVSRFRAQEDLARVLMPVQSDVGTSWISVPNTQEINEMLPKNSCIFYPGDEFGVIEPFGLNLVFAEIEMGKSHGFWGFYIDDTDPESEAGEMSIVNDHHEVFLYDSIDPEYLKDFRISFVYQNQACYNKAVELLSGLKVNTYMSVVLIRKGSVAAEFTLDQMNGSRPDCLLGKYREHYEGEVYKTVIKRDKWHHPVETKVPVYGY